MKITRQHLRRLILEAMTFSRDEIVQYLTDNARSYHQDRALDAGTIRELLYDDFIDTVGAQADIQEYKSLIDELSSQAPQPVPQWPGPEGRHWSKKDKNIRRIGLVDFEATEGLSGLLIKIGDRGDKGVFTLRDDVERDELIEFLNSLHLPNRSDLQ
mgnify:CR=1 FL=1